MKIDEKVVKLQIWDTAGQEKYRAITKNYYKGSHAIILMYDVTNPTSFMNIKSWITQIKQNLDEIIIILVGNKCDLKDLIKINSIDGKKFADKNSINFMETSSKFNINITESYMELARKLMSKVVGGRSKSLNLKNGDVEHRNMRCCYE